MALKDVFKHFSDEVRDTFHDKPYDPQKGRDKLMAAIRGAGEQHGGGKTTAPNKLWKVGNGGISFTLRLNGQPIHLNGQETNYMEASAFQPFLKELEREVAAGELDSEIKAAMSTEGTGKTTAAVRSTATGPKTFPADHPKVADPDAWAKLDAGSKIKAGNAYWKQNA